MTQQRVDGLGEPEFVVQLFHRLLTGMSLASCRKKLRAAVAATATTGHDVFPRRIPPVWRACASARWDSGGGVLAGLAAASWPPHGVIFTGRRRTSPVSSSMENLHHELWLTQAVNAVLGPVAAAILRALGRPVPVHARDPGLPGDAARHHAGLTAFALFVRSRLSVEHPGTLQVLLEDFVGVFNTPARRFRRARGPQVPADCRLAVPADPDFEPGGHGAGLHGAHERI